METTTLITGGGALAGLALLGPAGALLGGYLGWRHGDVDTKVNNLRQNDSAIVERVDEHETRITLAEKLGVKHDRAIRYLHDEGGYKAKSTKTKIAPTADWMARFE